MEYFDPQSGGGIVYAFHGSSELEPSHDFLLKGLKPERSYILRFQDGSSDSRTVSGKELLEKGLTVHLPQPNTSELVSLQEVLEHQTMPEPVNRGKKTQLGAS